MCFAFIAHAQTYQYVLQPGSTITPIAGIGNPTGPTEALSGTFSWTYVGDYVFNGQDDYQFVVTALHFSSRSYSLTFNSNPFNSGTGGGSFAFDPTVDTTGLAGSPASFEGPQGTYLGNGQDPSQLSISDYLYPASGPPVAAISFVAVPVPEPNALIVFGLGLLAVMGRQRRGQR